MLRGTGDDARPLVPTPTTVRFAFAGTPQFGAWVLEDLVQAGRLPELVISQPARPRGRGRKVVDPPVAQAATVLDLPLLSTPNVNDPEVVETLRRARAECLVVAAFGQLFTKQFLAAVPCLNVHASLLPAYRGPAPIHWALRNGDRQTGVSIMRIVEALDAGPVACRVALSVALWDDAGSVGRALALLGALAMDKVLQAMEDGTVRWEEQPEEGTYAPKVTAADRLLDFRRSAVSCHNLVRSLVPAAAAEVSAGPLLLKVWRTWPWWGPSLIDLPPEAVEVSGRPGRVARSRIAHGRERLFVGCGEGALEILALQPAGRPVMSAAEFLHGYGGRIAAGLDLPADEVGGTGPEPETEV